MKSILKIMRELYINPYKYNMHTLSAVDEEAYQKFQTYSSTWTSGCHLTEENQEGLITLTQEGVQRYLDLSNQDNQNRMARNMTLVTAIMATGTFVLALATIFDLFMTLSMAPPESFNILPWSMILIIMGCVFVLPFFCLIFWYRLWFNKDEF